MAEPEQERYHVVLHEPTGPNDLGEMTGTQLRAFLGSRSVLDAVAQVLQDLKEKGTATTYFDYPPLGPRTRVVIRRVPMSYSAQ